MLKRAISVLAVDDDRALLDVYSRTLGRAGYRCVTTQTGKEALERLKSDAIDVLLTDISMPGMSGLEFMRQARARDPDLPILVVTGNTGFDAALESIDAGVFRYLLKPLSPPEIVHAVSTAIHARDLAHARHAAYSHLAGLNRAAPTPEVLLTAIETMWLAVQPIVSPTQRTVVAYEALLRTRDATLREPLKVLSAAEQLDMLPAVGRAVRMHAARIVAKLPAGVDLFVNLHARDLLDDQLFARTAALSVQAVRVVFEVTERSSFDGVPDPRARIAQLKALGFRFAIDDMGAGYAGLSSFAMVKPSFVKIDVELVHDIDGDPIKQTLTRSILELAQGQSISVIAEGVETAGESQMLSALGCDLQQGYLFARPGAPFPAASFAP
jgi:EAL domain-containing protein (putative c-di-GMP-specific phosphodiesterase class I)